MKRTINVTVTYNIDDSPSRKMWIEPKNTVRKRVKEQMADVFMWDEDCKSIKVTVVDEP